ncbi:anaerobic ribonucleoside-triphosphate reductase activating protein [Cellulomonas bogoriensis]|uniref:Ribonucleoside-triphosphate reductase n=1 Tax=Cellulomonas bogoriensis 69B4 = DSM 16987 TaxID=1386082 RepID=A0A0A0BW46_9CELL|nr:anaerobic ribonucleoside-triphosphate reductase activating protein [Cellulomonas bogoriensis]KGM11907.1 ribonucleoside-triphosphate reductase [Cellulomonas bogoriensis 69B4 = DSM 16987]
MPPPAQRGAEGLQIAGLVPLSTCDWPGRLVATVFCQGCPLDCGYCHNPGLIDPRTPGTVRWSQVMDLLSRRVGRLDGVVLSGGEPTRQPGLPDAVRQVREAGFGVGLHTAGPYPGRLAQLLPLVDWVGLDVKAPLDLYEAVTGRPGAGERAMRSLELVLDSGVDHQVRTTVDPTTMDDEAVARLRGMLASLGVRDHVLQEVRVQGVRERYATALTAHQAGVGPGRVPVRA